MYYTGVDKDHKPGAPARGAPLANASGLSSPALRSERQFRSLRRRLLGTDAREAEALQAAGHARQLVEHFAHPVRGQEVVEGEDGGAGVDAHHVAADPAAGRAYASETRDPPRRGVFIPPRA